MKPQARSLSLLIILALVTTSGFASQVTVDSSPLKLRSIATKETDAGFRSVPPTH